MSLPRAKAFWAGCKEDAAASSNKNNTILTKACGLHLAVPGPALSKDTRGWGSCQSGPIKHSRNYKATSGPFGVRTFLTRKQIPPELVDGGMRAPPSGVLKSRTTGCRHAFFPQQRRSRAVSEHTTTGFTSIGGARPRSGATRHVHTAAKKEKAGGRADLKPTPLPVLRKMCL